MIPPLARWLIARDRVRRARTRRRRSSPTFLELDRQMQELFREPELDLDHDYPGRVIMKRMVVDRKR